ncbi:sn-glycerol-3-phosphate ABC transporter ATP-binding protein UgpC [Salmonella enterica subsp. enterica]|nr:sn-glycerol-3-phosphate ABC transporter ATP-binding protein UgpC [Salmonella enterica subsp. enterica]
MASIDIRAVQKFYGKTPAVRGVDLAVAPGEFVVILGPSGCGKSTLLRMIAGLEDISAGEISIDGVVVNEVDPAQRGCAMVFQNYALYPHMSVAQNIGYALKVSGVSRQERKERVGRIASMLGLESYLDRKPNALSGGQRQRVAMGRAMVRQPGIFLFDEPLSNLDAKLRVQMRLEIKRLHRELNATSVFVTHDQMEAMTLADKLVVMRDGKIEQVGAPSEVYRRPQSQFVAGFLGSPPMNFLPGIIDDNGRARLAGDRSPWPDNVYALAPNTRIQVAFRPGAARLSADISRRNVLPFDREMIEDLGNEIHIYGTAAGTRICIALAHETAAAAMPAGVLIPSNAAHVFLAETDRRIDPRLEGASTTPSLGVEQCRETSLSYI